MAAHHRKVKKLHFFRFSKEKDVFGRRGLHIASGNLNQLNGTSFVQNISVMKCLKGTQSSWNNMDTKMPSQN
jgi:hypothetical protein